MTFSVTDKIVLAFLFLNYYVISNLPLFYQVHQVIYYIQIFLFFIFVIVYFDFDKFFSFRFKEFDYTKFTFYLSLIALCISAFYYNSSNMDFKTFLKIITYPILIYVFFYFFSSRLLFSNKKFEQFLWFILIFVLVNTIWGVIARFTGIKQHSAYPFHFLGFFTHPNTVAFTFTIGIPILVYKYFTNQVSKMFFYLCMGLFLYGLLFTLSRSGFMGVAFAILILTYTKSKKVFFTSIFLIFLVGITFIVEFLVVKADSSLSRAMLVVTAIDMIMRSTTSFLWGYGVFNSIEIFKTEKVMFGNFEMVVDPHNILLLLGIQFGMVFAILILVTIFSIFIKYLFYRKTVLQDDKPKLNLCIALTLGLLLQNILEDIIVYPEYFVMPIFLIFLGYIYLYPDKLKKLNEENS